MPPSQKPKRKASFKVSTDKQPSPLPDKPRLPRPVSQIAARTSCSRLDNKVPTCKSAMSCLVRVGSFDKYLFKVRNKDC